MEPVKERESPMAQAQASNDDGQSLFLEPQRTPRRGVDSREVVLQQFRERQDIIMLDIEDDDGSISQLQSTETYTATKPLTSLSTSAQVIERRTIASSLPAPVKANSTVGDTQSGVKRRLFSSANAKETMYKFSGLLSPPSDPDSPQSNVGPIANDIPNHSSWSFGNLDIHQDEQRSQDWAYDASEAGELSMQLAQLVNPEVAAGGISKGSSAQPAPASEVASSMKDAIEAEGIARSQMLRAKRKQSDTNERGRSSSSPTPHHPSVGLQQKHDTSHKIQKARENQWEDLEELSADEIERQLDFAEMLRNGDRASGKTSNSSRGNTDRTRTAKPNSYSRTEADKFRTQTRHLEIDDNDDGDDAFAKTILASNDLPDVITPEEQKAREERLIRMKMGAFPGKPILKTKEKEMPARPVKFHSPWDDKPRPKQKNALQRPQKHSRQAIREMMGTASVQDDSAQNDQDDNNAGSSRRAVPSLAVLEQLSARKATVGAARNNTGDWRDRYDMLPQQGDNLNLPKEFSSMSEARQGLLVKRETLKERKKDLDSMLEVYKAFTRLLTLDELGDSDTKQLAEVKKFSVAVLDNDKSGKSARKRMLDISNNVKRRVQRLTSTPDEIDEEAASHLLPDIMSPEHYEKLQEEYEKTHAELSPVLGDLEKLRESNKARANRTREGHSKGCGTAKGSMSHLSKSERSREVYYRSLDKKIEQGRAQLARFNQGEASATARADTGDLEIVDNQDNESAISEEDAVNNGDDFMRPLGSTKKLTRSKDDGMSIEEINRLEDERQKIEAARPAQAADMSLLQQMAAKAEQANHASSQGGQKHDSQMLQNMRRREAARAERKRKQEEMATAADAKEKNSEVAEDDSIEVESSREFDDSDLEEEDEEDAAEEEDDEGQPVCKRYIVKACIVGVSAELDEDEHLLGKFLNKQKAIKKVSEIAPWVQKEFARCNPDSDNSSFSITTKDLPDEYEQQMTLGVDGDAGCRTWIEEELYNPSEEAYENAKVYKACKQQEVWYVDWERIIKPVQEDEDEEMEDADQVDEQDSAEQASEPVAPSSPKEHQETPAAQVDSVTASPTQSATASETDENWELVSIHPDGAAESPAQPVTVANTDANQDSIVPATDDNDTSPSTSFDSLFSTNDDEDDDLFSPDPESSTLPSTPPSTPPSPSSPSNQPTSPVEKERTPTKPAPSPSQPKPSNPLITRPNFTQLRLFSSLALANRHAKEVFMHWFIEHLRGAHNLGYIRTEDENMEEELRSIGDRAAWSREEDFVVMREGKDEQGEKRVNDSFRVWVSKKKVARM
ncbi:hypothetical protein PMZ80_000107 [Knufia obscura]|uniref:Uncharacterized protein n=1 Tax=Knufia obscura TaxID=1635080 RepID=A0ABR0S0C7_9EURO|nr:hypothetical protein PMZ80_000107 [Knufia obscura]